MQQTTESQKRSTAADVPQARNRRQRKTDWQRRRRLLLAQGRWDPTEHRSPVPAHAHLVELTDAYGLSCEALSDLSGIGTRAIFELRDGGSRTWITPSLEQRVLATEFDLDRLADNRRLSAIGTQRRIRALQRLGWSFGTLSGRLGVTVQAVSQIFNRDHVQVITARRIAHLYDELAMTPGPSVRGARRALRAGFAPPLAWDEGSIDDHRTQPHLEEESGPAGTTHFRAQVDDEDDIDEIAVERALAGDRVRLTHAEAHAAARRGVARGMSDPEIAAVVGVVSETILRWRRDCGLQSRYYDLGWAS